MRPTCHPEKPASLTVAALGVVYGDIGTSPLYTLRESFRLAGLTVNEPTVLGILSLITWMLLLTVTLKYVAIMLRADNRGEGGILALTTLAVDQFAHPAKRGALLLLGLAGAALFYGDTLITPAISVLSAVEGLHLVAPGMAPYVLPIALVIIILLFGIQRHGTGAVGLLFGPVMLLWFSVLALLGFSQVVNNPAVLAALSPHHAWAFVMQAPGVAFLTMGAVVLAVTGAEALYADMGHFGRKPVQRAWVAIALPALLLTYFGQGALILATPEAIANPFYLMVPQTLLLPLVLLATLATVIASQAVICGAFSLTQQAIQLGYLPRMDIRYTSARHVGQVYIPILNWMLCSAITILVLGFGSSGALAGAYGIAVTGTMLISTIMVAVVLRQRNGWPWLWLVPFTAVFIAMDAAFLAATLMKIPSGGWFTLTVSAVIFFVMHTWLKGREQAHQLQLKQTPPLEKFLETLPAQQLIAVPRTGIFLTSDINHAPIALIHNIAHNGVLHAQTVVMKISRARIPRYPSAERISVHHLAHGFATVQATYGFMEQPNVPHLLAQLPAYGLTIKHPDNLSYFLGTHTYIPSPHKALSPVQEPVFILLDKFARSAVAYFNIPRRQVIEIGNQVEI